MTVLLSLRSMIGETARTTRGFRVPALLAVALTYLIIAVAFTRLQLYIGDNGLTPLRFYSSVFSVWIGVGFAMVSLRLLEWRPDRAWMLPALVTSGLTTLAGLDLANPEAIIARDALARNERSVLWHVDKLSGDGIAVLVDGMGTLDPDLQIELSDTLCSVALGRRGDLIDGGDGFLDWNVGRSRGRDAVVELCAFDR
ncbi:MAG: DUF4153 domain-containing protein [Acidimicrobiales bacterium]